MLGEIVADALSAKLLRNHVAENADEYEDADWDRYYYEFSRYMTHLLPAAHKLMVPEVV